MARSARSCRCERASTYGLRSSILFLLNHRDVAVDVPITQAGTNLVDGTQVHAGLLKIGPFGAAVIREGW